MIRYRFAILCAFVLLVLSAISASGTITGLKYKTNGVYVDSAGKQHAWSITDAHTLLWDGDPYMPVGAVFTPKCIASGATEENFQADTTSFESLKSQGITDILLKSPGPITSTDVSSWQKVIDYLDSNGFTYGIELDDGPKDALSGYLISPNRYRLAGPSDQTDITCHWSNVDSAMFVIVKTFDNTIKSTGLAAVSDGNINIHLPAPLAAGEVLLVYPHKTFKSVAKGGVGDIWSGFNEYRDRVMGFFKGIKFGAGMRFFMEPFSSKMDFTGEMVGFLPDSSGFRLGLEAYLTRRHTHEGAVNAAWGLQEPVSSIEAATRLVPLWTSSRGISFAYDKSKDYLAPVDVTVSQAWRDIVDFRDTSAQSYMNAISDTLHTQVANVPVVFKCSSYHRVYANPFGMAGFDGLAPTAYGLGLAPVTETGGPAYALAEESGKTTWFIVSGAQVSSANSTAAVYNSQKEMTESLSYFREVGAKGFFVDSVTNDTKQVDWLAAFKKAAPKDAEDFKPDVVYYPTVPETGAYVRRLAENTWWLPTLNTGKTTYIGDGMLAYGISGEDRSCIWSTSGDRTITLKSGPLGIPSVAFPSNMKLIPKKNGLFEVKLTDAPVVLRGIDFALIFPQETAQNAIERLIALLPEADKVGLNVKKAKASVDDAQRVLSNSQPMIAYGIAQSAINDLMTIMGADVWVEGEKSIAHNFDGVVAVPGASGGIALTLNTDDDPPLMPYTAAYSFETQANSSYEMWVGGSQLSETSPLSYTIDDAGWNPVKPDDSSKHKYGQSLSWYKIGVVNLFPGKHVIKFRVDSRRSLDNRYYCIIDALVFSAKGFDPTGQSSNVDKLNRQKAPSN